MTRSYFHVNRVFHVDTPKDNRAGWYFEVRDGPPHGPYAFRVLAEMALAGYLGNPGRTRDVRREPPMNATADARRQRASGSITA